MVASQESRASVGSCLREYPRAGNTVNGIRTIESWMRMIRRGEVMNRDQVKGTAKDIAGKVQQKAGEVTGSTSQQVKGMEKQVEGKLQKSVGNLQQSAEDAQKEAQKNANKQRG